MWSVMWSRSSVDLTSFAKAGATTAEPEPLFVRLAQLGGRVDYFRVGAGSSSGPLEPTRAATNFFQALLELHGSFARFLLPPCAAEVTLPYAERRLPGMSRAGLAQALAGGGVDRASAAQRCFAANAQSLESPCAPRTVPIVSRAEIALRTTRVGLVLL